MKLVITQEILDLNPGLALELGQEINLPGNAVSLDNESQNLDDDPPGTGSDRPKNPPPRP